MPDGSKAFRNILGHYPTGVCAVTAADDKGAPVGMIIGSFTSVSLEPRLVGFLPARSSSTWSKIEAAGKFCINVLGDSQHGVCASLSRKGDDKFADIEYGLSELGSPIIDGTLAWIDCELDAVHDAGDHVFVLGRVHSLDLHAEGNPMIFHKGGYSKVIPV